MSPDQFEWVKSWSALMSAVLVLVGVIYTARMARRSTDQAANVGLVGQLFTRLGSLEKQVQDLWTARQEDADRYMATLHERDLSIQQRDDHIDVLENHIWRQLPPPPPAKTY